MILTPVDTLKTTLQVQGASGTALLRQRIKTNGIGSLWWGAIATAAATFVGHYPWFATVSSLNLHCDTRLCADQNLVQLPLRKRSRAIKALHNRMVTASSLHWLRRLPRLRLHLQLSAGGENLPPSKQNSGWL